MMVFAATMLAPAGDGGVGARSGAVVVRHFRAGDLRARRAAVACHPALQARTQDPRRPDAGGPDLGGAAGGRRISAVAFSAHQFHRCVFRGRIGLDHHRRHGALGPGIPAPLDQSVASSAELAGRHGHHRAGRGHPADAGRRRHADLPGRNAGSDEGQQTHAAHRPDRQAVVGRVCRTDGRLHRLPEIRRDELVRRRLPWILGARTRRLLHLRRQHRTFQLAAHRDGADGISDSGGPEFRDALPRLEPARRHGLFSGRRGQGDLGDAGGQLHRHIPVLVLQGQLPGLSQRTAPHHLQSGVDRDGQWFAYPGLFALADIRAHVDDVLELHRGEFRIDRAAASR